MNLDSLSQIALAIAQERSVEKILKLIVEQVIECPAGSLLERKSHCSETALVRIWLIAPGDICEECHLKAECRDHARCLHLVASLGTPNGSSRGWSGLDGFFRRFPIGVRKVGRIAATGEPIFIPDVTSDTRWIVHPEWMREEGITSFVGHPLVFRGETLGVLGVLSRAPLDADAVERLRTFADHAAIAIANARAFEEVETLRRRLERENDYLQEEMKEELAFGDIVGQSTALQKVLRQIELVAPTDANVLITGESGTGKELIARAIHERSARKNRPLIKVNCGAIPESLFESEFFGHVRGAFTGAIKDRTGRFQLADGGTLFLDEVGEIPLALQSKLLRVLQEQQFERVGEERTRSVHVRIIAATNRNLKTEAEAGRFRRDLFYRLGVFPIDVPPLRERREDIPSLARHFIGTAAKRINCRPPRLTSAHIAQLQAYEWPGNVRELQNVIERAVILAQRGSLRFDLQSVETMEMKAVNEIAPAGDLIFTRAELRQRERESIKAALEKTGGRVFGPTGAAELLGMKPTTLASRIKALGLR